MVSALCQNVSLALAEIAHKNHGDLDQLRPPQDSFSEENIENAAYFKSIMLAPGHTATFNVSN